MIKTALRSSALALMAIAATWAPAQILAQNTNPPPVTKSAASPGTEQAKPDKKPVAGPFHGKLAAIDQVAKTITVGKRTFQITAASKIKKAGQPALLKDGVVGEPVSGYVKPSPDGKLVATTVNFGPKLGSSSGVKAEPTDKTKN